MLPSHAQNINILTNKIHDKKSTRKYAMFANVTTH